MKYVGGTPGLVGGLWLGFRFGVPILLRFVGVKSSGPLGITITVVATVAQGAAAMYISSKAAQNSGEAGARIYNWLVRPSP